MPSDESSAGTPRRYQRIRRPQWADTVQFLHCPWMRNHRVAQFNHSLAEGATWP